MVEEMAIASWHPRRAFAIENQMMENEMNACNHARNELDRITLAFDKLADSRQLNLIQRYQTRLHNRHSRILRDFILVRKSLASAEAGDPGPYEVPASCIPTLASGWAHVANEPKSPVPSTNSTPGEPAANPPLPVSATQKAESPATQSEPDRFPVELGEAPICPLAHDTTFDISYDIS